jgi:hypothetical protein
MAASGARGFDIQNNSFKEITMDTEKKESTELIERYFEQPPNAVSFYCDFGQVLSTGHEVVIQLYETIPSPPGRDGKITKVITRLRATVTLSIPHARNVGKLLVEKTKERENEIK